MSRIVIRRIGEGSGDENVFVTSGGDENVFVTGIGAHLIRELHGDGVVLRCSEGDATITVDKEEAEETFLCPKHSTPMEPIASRSGSGVRVIRRGSPHEH